MGQLQTFVIVGGGTAAYMSALCLSRALEGVAGCRIRVVERPLDGGDSACLIGADSAPPPIRAFHALLGLSETQIVTFAQGAPSLGALMTGWTPDSAVGDTPSSYVQSTGESGARLDTVAFHHFITWLRKSGQPAELETYNLAAQAAKAGKFQPPSQDATSIFSTYSYGLNLDVAAYAAGLKSAALARGVAVTPSTSLAVELSAEGHIASLTLSNGERVAGDLFIDATGPQGLLIRQGLGAAFAPATGLTVRRAVAVRLDAPMSRPMNRCDEIPGGYILATGLKQTQHLALLHDPDVLDSETADQTLTERVSGKTVIRRRFEQGRLTEAWRGNCIAIGLSASVLEPLGGVSGLFGAQVGLTRLLALFPDAQFYPSLRREYNRLVGESYDRRRDFVLAHYALSGRLDPALWPETLTRKIEQFKSRGRVVLLDDESFNEQDWVSLFFGMGLTPERYDPLIDSLDADSVKQRLKAMAQQIAQTLAAMPAYRKTAFREMTV